jgi:hypothetical protein
VLKKLVGGVEPLRQRLKRHFARVKRHPLGMEGLMSEEELKRELTRERARSDRSGRPFSLMLIDIMMPHEQPEYERAVRLLTTVLNRRLRMHDGKGWYRGRIAVILPDVTTETVGAVWKAIEVGFVAEAHADLPKRLPLPDLRYEVFSYPNAARTAHPREHLHQDKAMSHANAVK